MVRAAGACGTSTPLRFRLVGEMPTSRGLLALSARTPSSSTSGQYVTVAYAARGPCARDYAYISATTTTSTATTLPSSRTIGRRSATPCGYPRTSASPATSCKNIMQIRPSFCFSREALPQPDARRLTARADRPYEPLPPPPPPSISFGPMTAEYQPNVVNVTAQLVAAGVRAHALDLTLPHPMTGCFGHPSAADNVEIAAKAKPQIAAVMGW